MPSSLVSKVSSTSVPASVSVTFSVTGVPQSRFERCLLGDLRDLERLGLLGRVRVLRAGVHLELLQHLAAEAVLREHPPDGVLDGLAGVLLQQLTDRGGAQTAGEAGVPVGELLGRLVAGER